MSTLAPAFPFKLALVQLGNIKSCEKDNLEHAREKIEEAADNGANVVVMPVRVQHASEKIVTTITAGMFQFTLRHQILQSLRKDA